MDFNIIIGESLDFDFDIGNSAAEALLLVGSAEVVSDGIKGISGVAEFIESIIQEV